MSSYPPFRPDDEPDYPDYGESYPADDYADYADDQPITDSDAYADELDDADAYVADERPVTYRGSSNDPVFGYLVVMALSIGLMPLIPDNTDLRYVLVWSVLAGFGVLTWLLGDMTRIGQEKPENLAWGVAFGLIIGTPMLAVGGETLATTSRLLFSVTVGGRLTPLPLGAVLGLLIFAQPVAETLFFRGVLQENRSFWVVGLAASAWSLLLFFPMLDVFNFPVVGIVIGTALVMMNIVYSYVRQRNGLAAAWLSQIVVNFVLIFLPYIGG